MQARGKVKGFRDLTLPSEDFSSSFVQASHLLPKWPSGFHSQALERGEREGGIKGRGEGLRVNEREGEVGEKKRERRTEREGEKEGIRESFVLNAVLTLYKILC